MLVVLCTLLAAAECAAASPVLTIDRADARFEPQGQPAVDRTDVNLLRRWDLDFPGRGGRAVYRVVLPRHAGTEAMAILFSRVGNQAVVSINGVSLQRWGRLGDPAFDAGKVARMAVVPASLLRPDRDNDLTVEVTVQQQRWGGLSALKYGPEDAIEPLYQYQLR